MTEQLPPWSDKPDPERPNARIYVLDFASDGYFLVSEVGVGEWRWMYCNDEGNVVSLGKVDYPGAAEARAAAELYARGEAA